MNIEKYLNKLSIKQKQWFWFVVLWFLGLASITILAYLIKLLINGVSHT